MTFNDVFIISVDLETDLNFNEIWKTGGEFLALQDYKILNQNLNIYF